MTEQQTEQQLFEQVQSVIRRWRDGTPVDAREAMAHIPGIDGYPSLMIDLAYEQYCLEEAAGERPGVSTYCARFGPIESQLRDVLEGHRVLLSNPQLLQVAAWPAPGDQWDHIRFRRELGRGAFARAYLVEDASINRPVVLKLSHRDSAEGLSLGTLQHPHIVNILWSRAMNGFHVVAMPFEGSATLLAILDSLRAKLAGPLTSAAILTAAAHADSNATGNTPLLTGKESFADGIALIAERVAEALGYAQRQGISHGDLKPANILISSTGHPFLIDFNLASDANRARAVLGGTLPYMAPERLACIQKGTAHTAATESSDVYSFGVVLYEALTGQLPFGRGDDESPREAVAAELARRGTVAVSRPANLPRPLFNLIRDCLAEAADRRPSFSAIANRLARRRRRGRWVRATAVIMLSAGILGAAGWRLFGRSDPEPAARVADPLPLAAPPQPVQPVTAEEFVARARAFLKAGDAPSAAADYSRAQELRPDGATAAELGYALMLSGHEPSAWFHTAINRFNFREPWALNNLAAALVPRRRDVRADMDRARQLTAEALQRVPQARPAQHNQALAEYWLDVEAGTLELRDFRSIAHIAARLKEDPQSAELYLDAAIIYSGGTQGHMNMGVDFALEAIRRGQSAASVKQNPFLKRLRENCPQFDPLLTALPVQQPRPNPRKPSSARWMAPPFLAPGEQ